MKRYAICGTCQFAHSPGTGHKLIGGPEPSKSVRDLAAVASTVERALRKDEVGGSNPPRGSTSVIEIPQTVEDVRRLVDEIKEIQKQPRRRMTREDYRRSKLPNEHMTRPIRNRPELVEKAKRMVAQGLTPFEAVERILAGFKPASGREHLYRCFDAAGSLLYVGISLKIAQRLGMHAKESLWWHDVETIKVERFRTRAEARAREVQAIKTEHPLFNIADQLGGTECPR